MDRKVAFFVLSVYFVAQKLYNDKRNLWLAPIKGLLRYASLCAAVHDLYNRGDSYDK